MPQNFFISLSRAASACLCGVAILLAGCNTLASLGLPVGTSGNKLMSSAKSISDAPGRSVSLPTELAEQPLLEWFISVGDTVLIEPVSFDSTIRLAGDQIVKPNGMLSLGEFGEFTAVGKSVDQLKLEVQALIDSQLRQRMQTARANELAVRLQREALQSSGDDSAMADDGELDKDALRAERLAERVAEFEFEQTVLKTIDQNRISVRVVNWASKRFYVLGEVNSPGFYSYTGTEDVLFAITEAGGLTSKADSHQIIVVRPTPCGSCKIVLKTCYDHIVQLGDTSTNYQILPGDRVFVPALTFREDLKRSLGSSKNDRCPRCADCLQGCCLPVGCPISTEISADVLEGSAPGHELLPLASESVTPDAKQSNAGSASVAEAAPRPLLER